MPKSVFKDDSKDDQQKAVKRANAIVTVEAALGKIIGKPAVWDDPDMDNIWSMVCQIGTDRENSPFPLDDEENEEPESLFSCFSETYSTASGEA